MKKSYLILIILLIGLGVVVYFKFFNKQVVDTAKKIDSIKEYGYTLYGDATKEYKDTFAELKELLSKKDYNEEEYVSLITKLFIMDFYTLDNKLTNMSIGGVEFVYSGMQKNFKENAHDTLYKYVESNLYGDRKQALPYVTEVKIDSVKNTVYLYEDKKDKNAYQVKASWTYKKELGYDKEKTLFFVHEDKKLSLVEMS